MLKKIIILSILLIFPAIAGQSPENSNEIKNFNSLLREYNSLYEDNADLETTFRKAIEVYQLAHQTYGKYTIETAESTYNLARLISEVNKRGFSAEGLVATGLYREYFEILDTIDAPQNKKYLDRLIEYIRVEYTSLFIFYTHRNLKKAIRLYKKLKLNNTEKAEVEINIADLYAILYEDKKARSYYNKSIKSYTKEYGKEHPSVIKPMMALINLDIKKINTHISNALDNIMYENTSDEKKDIRKAKKEFNKLSKNFERTKLFINKFELPEKLNSDLATIQRIYDDYYDKFNNFAYSNDVYESVELQKQTIPPIDLISNLKPIERKNPIYPANAARKGLEGWVLVKFDLTKDGKTKNVRLIETSHDIFVRYALMAASKYIYEPPLQGETSTEVQNLRVRIDFKLEKKTEGEEI